MRFSLRSGVVIFSLLVVSPIVVAQPNPQVESNHKGTKNIEVKASKIKLPTQIKARVEGIIELIANPSDVGVKAHYAPAFLEQVSAPILVSMFQQVALEARQCRIGEVKTLRDAFSAVVVLECHGINAELLVAVAQDAPHQIVGFSMRPSVKSASTP